jgi:hypothetical protein
LFSGKAEAAAKEEAVKTTDVKPYRRRKGGRKPIDPKIRREERIIDILLCWLHRYFVIHLSASHCDTKDRGRRTIRKKPFEMT